MRILIRIRPYTPKFRNLNFDVDKDPPFDSEMRIWIQGPEPAIHSDADPASQNDSDPQHWCIQ